jgi:hypothetical protein
MPPTVHLDRGDAPHNQGRADCPRSAGPDGQAWPTGPDPGRPALAGGTHPRLVNHRGEAVVGAGGDVVRRPLCLGGEVGGHRQHVHVAVRSARHQGEATKVEDPGPGVVEPGTSHLSDGPLTMSTDRPGSSAPRPGSSTVAFLSRRRGSGLNPGPRPGAHPGCTITGRPRRWTACPSAGGRRADAAAPGHHRLAGRSGKDLNAAPPGCSRRWQRRCRSRGGSAASPPIRGSVREQRSAGCW